MKDFKVRATISHLCAGGETMTVPRYDGRLFGPDRLRPVFNDTDSEVLSLVYPSDPTQLPKELSGVD